jgi:hypothetical protein
MKEIVKKVFSKKVTTPVFVIFGFFGILNFIIFPGLTTPDTGSNIVSALLAVVTLAFLFYYIDSFKLMEPPKAEPGETELDYIPKSDMGSIGTKPKTQTDYAKEHSANLSKKRKRSKSEFPVEPHRSTVKKSNPKQFDGVKSEEPFVKTRKK